MLDQLSNLCATKNHHNIIHRAHAHIIARPGYKNVMFFITSFRLHNTIHEYNIESNGNHFD